MNQIKTSIISSVGTALRTLGVLNVQSGEFGGVFKGFIANSSNFSGL